MASTDDDLVRLIFYQVEMTEGMFASATRASIGFRRGSFDVTFASAKGLATGSGNPSKLATLVGIGGISQARICS